MCHRHIQSLFAKLAMKPPAFIPGLDGVRALAIIAVILFHADIPGLAPGGFLGVDVFFTLSGFLITSLLLRELYATGKIGLRAFYGRRLRRLMPAMLAVVAASSLAAALWAPEAIARQRLDIPAALLYASNWWQIYSGQSYFELFGRPPLLQHLWSLAIEEQFYLVWPLVLLGVGRLTGRHGVLLLALALALLSTGWMAWLAIEQAIPSQASPNRLYLGADTHAMGLLIGACLACLWNPLAPYSLPRKRDGASEDAKAGGPHPWAMELAGLVGIAGVIAAFLLASEASAWLYQGGFALVALLSCLVMMGASEQRTLLGSILGHPVLRFIGQRSYGLYLWHWPIFVLLRPDQELPGSPWMALGLRLLVTAALTELSFRLIENPVRCHPPSTWQRKGWAGLAAACCAGGVVLAQLYQARAETAAQLPAAPTRLQAGASAPQLAPGGFILTAIGDSVLLGSQGQLARTLWPILVDAQIGRQGSEGVKRVRELRHASALADTVLVHLGTNGYLHESNLNDILQELSDRKQVIFMTVHASRRWVDDNNALLTRVVARYANARLINWQLVATEHPEYLAADGVHLNVQGMQAYAGLISQAVGYRPPATGAAALDASRSVLSGLAVPAPKARTTPGADEPKPASLPARPRLQARLAGAY
jgi:peptidoglycan/LPS O-acetylase OafA/YrhL/lysophospholipase L1-like esterase